MAKSKKKSVERIPTLKSAKRKNSKQELEESITKFAEIIAAQLLKEEFSKSKTLFPNVDDK